MDIIEARDRVQRQYDMYYPDTSVDVQIVSGPNNAKALYIFTDYADEGEVLCTEKTADAFVAFFESDLGDKCDDTVFYEMFSKDAEDSGFEAMIPRRLTWRKVLEFLQEQPDKYLDTPAIAWVNDTPCSRGYAIVAEQMRDYDIDEEDGISMAMNILEGK